MTLVTTLRAHADRRPHFPFVTLISRGRRETLTFQMLWNEARQTAGALSAIGVREGDVVIIMLRHESALYNCFLGAMTAGAIPSFMPYPTPKQQPELFWASHAKLFDRIRPAAIIVYDEIVSFVQQAVPANTKILTVAALKGDALESPAPAACDPASVAFLQHSSGTTGLKKGVMLSHQAVLAQIGQYRSTIGFDETSIIASWLPLYHDMGLIACFMLPLIAGAHVLHLDPFDWVSQPTSLLDEIETNRATHSWIPNFAFNHLAATGARAGRTWDLSSLKALINCSEPCKAESMALFARTFADSGVTAATPQVCYAMAEAVFAVSQTRLGAPVPVRLVSRSGLLKGVARLAENEADAQPVASCGPPIPGAEVRIVDKAGILCSDGLVGEICIGGASLYAGYQSLPHLTADKLIDGRHHTGDLGFWLEGELHVTGRKDDLIIVRGRNYYAHDLEAIASGTDGVRPGRVVTFDVDTAALGTAEVICLLEIEDGALPLKVRRAVKARVESLCGLVLGRIVIVPAGALRKTTSGKISRDANRNAYLENLFAKDPVHA
jgi:fatty-acyl-CoA synthase